VLRRRFGTTLAARTGDRSHRHSQAPMSPLPYVEFRRDRTDSGSPPARRVGLAGTARSGAADLPWSHLADFGGSPVGYVLATQPIYRGVTPALPRVAGQMPRHKGDYGEYRHNQDGRDGHLHKLWHGSVSPITGAVAECAPHRGRCLRHSRVAGGSAEPHQTARCVR
jgi:hypothetical protein